MFLAGFTDTMELELRAVELEMLLANALFQRGEEFFVDTDFTY